MSHDLGDPSRVGPAVGIAGVSVDLDAGTVDLPAGVRLDLGGVGKGLAADLVAEGLVDRGATGAAVGMGGDVRVAGRGPEDGAWNIDIEDPLDEGYMMATWALRDGAEAAVVTSTRMIRRWRHAGRDVHHLIDPATGRSADNELAAVVVAANEAWWAEGFAKAVLVAGTADGTLLLQRHNLHAMLVDTDGDTVEVRG
jgi:thiamine biosynthesis lipoprotein